jgi:hypothetical protein
MGGMGALASVRERLLISKHTRYTNLKENSILFIDVIFGCREAAALLHIRLDLDGSPA